MPTSQENEWGSEIQEIDSLEENNTHLEASVEQVEESVEQISGLAGEKFGESSMIPQTKTIQISTYRSSEIIRC